MTDLVLAKTLGVPADGWLASLVGGAIGGFLLALLLVAVGLIRFVLHLGHTPTSSAISAADIRPIAFYVLGFVTAGAMIGLILPKVQHRWSRLATYAGGGVIVGLMVVEGSAGIEKTDSTMFMVFAMIGAFLGLAFGLPLTRGEYSSNSTSSLWTPEVIEEYLKIQTRGSREAIRSAADGLANLPESERLKFPPEIVAFINRSRGIHS